MTPRFWRIDANIEIHNRGLLNGGADGPLRTIREPGPKFEAYSETRQVPSFILDGDILGIVSQSHAEDIARDMLINLSCPVLMIGVTITAHVAACPVDLDNITDVNIRHAARAVIANWSSGDLAGAVNYLQDTLEEDTLEEDT